MSGLGACRLMSGALAAGLCWLLLAGAVSPLAAQDEKKAPMPAAKDEPIKLPPGAILFVTKQINDALKMLPESVVLSAERLKRERQIGLSALVRGLLAQA